MRWEKEKRDELGERKERVSKEKKCVRVLITRSCSSARVSDPYN